MKTYYKFQIEDSDKMMAIGNSIHNGEPGIGKSSIAVRLITGRTLIIVPKSVIYQMQGEVLAFRPELSPTVIFGTPAQRRKLFKSAGSLIICTYEQLRIDCATIADLQPFETLIMDELHRLASTTTKLHKTLRGLLKYYQTQNYPAPRIYGTSASIIMNSPMDLFGIFSILRPGLFPNFFHFTTEYMYRHPTFGYLLGPRTSKLAKLGEIIKPYVIRRTLAEVAPEMPPHIDEIIKFDLSPKETKLYNDIRVELLLEIDPIHIDLVKNPISLQNALTKMQKLSELTDTPDLIGHSEIPSTKIAILQEKLQELLSGNQRKCVVFSRFARMVNILEPLLKEYNPVVIQGSVSGPDRQTAITKFKTDSTCRLMLITTAGSEGISLEEAQYLIRLDTPFSIGRDIQLTGRIRRITSEEPTFSYTLAARKTVDENMLKILEKKKLINSSVFGWDEIKELLS